MSCGCKSKGNKRADGSVINNTPSNESLGQRIIKYGLKTFAFLLLVAALPIINLVIIWFMFRTLVLNKEIDIKPLLLAIGNKFKEKDEDNDDDDDDFENLTEDDVVMLDVEEITNTSK